MHKIGAESNWSAICSYMKSFLICEIRVSDNQDPTKPKGIYHWALLRKKLTPDPV